MTRHARQLLEDDWQNPYDAFRRLRRIGRRDALAFRLAGEWVNRPRYPNLPAPLVYLIDTPTIAITTVLAPLRALISPFTGFPDFQRATARAGYRYLLRYPEGAHQRELVEQAATEQVDQLERLDRRDQRASVLRGVATEFPDSEGGRDAGKLTREELEQASPQHIRITRGFLLENPTVAGDTGVGLNPQLLNGDVSDGELHEEGVVLRGGRVLEILLTAEGRDEDTPPDREQAFRETLSPDELERRGGITGMTTWTPVHESPEVP